MANTTVKEWLSPGVLIAIVTALMSAVTVYAGNVAAQAKQDERISQLREEQTKLYQEQHRLRVEMREELREIKSDVRKILIQMPGASR